MFCRANFRVYFAQTDISCVNIMHNRASKYSTHVSRRSISIQNVYTISYHFRIPSILYTRPRICIYAQCPNLLRQRNFHINKQTVIVATGFQKNYKQTI